MFYCLISVSAWAVWCFCVCMCICMYLCMYACMYLCMFVYVCIYTHTHTHTHAHISNVICNIYLVLKLDVWIPWRVHSSAETCWRDTRLHSYVCCMCIIWLSEKITWIISQWGAWRGIVMVYFRIVFGDCPEELRKAVTNLTIFCLRIYTEVRLFHVRNGATTWTTIAFSSLTVCSSHINCS